MSLRDLSAALLRVDIPGMQPRSVVVAKSLALTWLLTGHAFFQPRLFLPFGAHGGAEPFHAGPAIAFVSACACAALLLTPFIRTSALVLAGTIAATTWASLGYFAHNRLFVAALLALIAVSPRNHAVRLARYQVALVYLVAALDKVLDPDFTSGRVLAALVRGLVARGPIWSPSMLAPSVHPWPSWLAALADAIGPSSHYAGLSASVIVVELLLAAGYLASAAFVPWLALLLHGGVFLVTGSTFGVFFHAMLAATVFVSRRSIGPREMGIALLATSVFAGPLVRPEWVLLVPFAAALVREAPRGVPQEWAELDA